MEQRMKEGAMTPGEIEDLLNRAPVGRLTTLGEDGWPYTVAVHFLWKDGLIYFHGLSRGEKLSNLLRDPRVCFEVDELERVVVEGIQTACQADAIYRSIVLRGTAVPVEDGEKADILTALAAKYLPHPMPMSEGAVRETAVVAIRPHSLTGKQHA